ncbi:hypothetical protein MASR2M18_05670 [Ignavibacteria bacterium]|nr:hypothetical protein [Bacteroidota bacterium]MCZ2132086.1 hypothetical protein [Bacteroidota bacterium]
MKWLSSLFGSNKPKSPDASVSVAPTEIEEKNASTVVLCACCLANYSPKEKYGAETICPHCGADATLRLVAAVVRYSSRLLANVGQTVLLIEPQEALLRQFDATDGLRVIEFGFADIVNSEKADLLETPDAVIMSRYVTGSPEECDAIQNIYGLLRRGGWLLMRGVSGYFAEQAGFAVHDNTLARIAQLPSAAAAGLNPEEKVLFCLKQSDTGRTTKAVDKERAELRARFTPE